MSQQTTVTITAPPELLEKAAERLRQAAGETERLPELMELGRGRLELLGATPDEAPPTLDGLEDNETEQAMRIARGLLRQIAKRQTEIKDAKNALEPLVKVLGKVEAAGLEAEYGPGSRDELTDEAWREADLASEQVERLLVTMQITPVQAKRAAKAGEE